MGEREGTRAKPGNQLVQYNSNCSAFDDVVTSKDQ